MFDPCKNLHSVLNKSGKGGVVGLYPAADEQYTFAAQPDEDRESYEILVDLRDDTNMWGVSALNQYFCLFCSGFRQPTTTKKKVGMNTWGQNIGEDTRQGSVNRSTCERLPNLYCNRAAAYNQPLGTPSALDTDELNIYF